MEKVIEIKDLTKVYKNGRGIWDISIDVFKGDIFGFLGPNGAGKTTAMKIMTGLINPDKGDIIICGNSIVSQYEKAMYKVGSIIEIAEAYPDLTGYQNVKLISRYYYNVDDIRIDEVLDQVGILNFKNEKTRNYSLGMKQRLGLACALVAYPEVVILDEPYNGLDVEGMVKMRTLIKELSVNTGKTFFISSHLIHDIEKTCNRIGIIYNGRMVSTDYVEEAIHKHDSLESYFLSEVGKKR